MLCHVVLVGAVHSDSTVSVVSFDIASTLKQKVGVALPASAAQLPKGDLTSRESSDVLAADSVGRWSGREEATSIRIQLLSLSSPVVHWLALWFRNP